MRGIPERRTDGAVRHRISPAHAGNTGAPPRARSTTWDQPRTCGEYPNPNPNPNPPRGSAPHMRGIRCCRISYPLLRRISPAHAGNTGRWYARPRHRGDQPRTCGEYREGLTIVARLCGSAPHMRGIPATPFLLHKWRWISPAHAGNTLGPDPPSSRSRDQPRTCGEYRSRGGRRCQWQGSAPHMRGIRIRCHNCGGHPGISPAHAGNTAALRRASSRGGISPAHAGNTNPLPQLRRPSGDQPRTCGEYQTPTGVGFAVVGSAPHMRGIRRTPDGRPLPDGISPAHAGNTG